MEIKKEFSDLQDIFCFVVYLYNKNNQVETEKCI